MRKMAAAAAAVVALQDNMCMQGRPTSEYCQHCMTAESAPALPAREHSCCLLMTSTAAVGTEAARTERDSRSY
jgi:hypothetical protein